MSFLCFRLLFFYNISFLSFWFLFIISFPFFPLDFSLFFIWETRWLITLASFYSLGLPPTCAYLVTEGFLGRLSLLCSLFVLLFTCLFGLFIVWLLGLFFEGFFTFFLACLFIWFCLVCSVFVYVSLVLTCLFLFVLFLFGWLRYSCFLVGCLIFLALLDLHLFTLHVLPLFAQLALCLFTLGALYPSALFVDFVLYLFLFSRISSQRHDLFESAVSHFRFWDLFLFVCLYFVM